MFNEMRLMCDIKKCKKQWLKIFNFVSRLKTNPKFMELRLFTIYIFLKSNDTKLNNEYFFFIVHFLKLSFFENLENNSKTVQKPKKGAKIKKKKSI